MSSAWGKLGQLPVQELQIVNKVKSAEIFFFTNRGQEPQEADLEAKWVTSVNLQNRVRDIPTVVGPDPPPYTSTTASK